MADTLLLRVLTPTGIAVEAPATDVVIPGAAGEFCVLPGHTPYLALTASGALSYSQGGRRHGLALRRGLVEVNEGSVTVVAEEVSLPDDIDPVQAESREKTVRQQLEDALSLGQPIEALEDEAAFVSAQRAVGTTSFGT